MYRCFKGLGEMVFWGCFSGPMATGVSRDWVICYGVLGFVSVDRWLPVFQWTGGYRCFNGLGGKVFLGCFSGPVVTGVPRDWVVCYGVSGVFQWTGGYRCFKGLGGMMFWGCFSGPAVTGVSRDLVVWCFGGVSVDRRLQVFQGNGWYGCFMGVSVDRWLQVFQGTGWHVMVFLWCFTGPVITGISRDLLV